MAKRCIHIAESAGPIPAPPIMTGFSKNIIVQYLQWYYFEVAKEILRGWRNYLWFISNYFSISLLLKTLFAPWRRYRFSYGRGFSLKQYLSSFSFNAFSRLVGFIIRIIFIILGVISEIIIFIAGLAVFLIWLGLPIILAAGLYFGFKILL